MKIKTNSKIALFKNLLSNNSKRALWDVESFIKSIIKLELVRDGVPTSLLYNQLNLINLSEEEIIMQFEFVQPLNMSANGHLDQIEGRVNKTLFDMLSYGPNPVYLDDDQEPMNITIPL